MRRKWTKEELLALARNYPKYGPHFEHWDTTIDRSSYATYTKAHEMGLRKVRSNPLDETNITVITSAWRDMCFELGVDFDDAYAAITLYMGGRVKHD